MRIKGPKMKYKLSKKAVYAACRGYVAGLIGGFDSIGTSADIVYRKIVDKDYYPSKNAKPRTMGEYTIEAAVDEADSWDSALMIGVAAGVSVGNIINAMTLFMPAIAAAFADSIYNSYRLGKKCIPKKREKGNLESLIAA